MTIKMCTGIVIALGQYELDMQGTRYSYIEIERHDGRVLRANNVVVLNNVASILCLGVEGQFHFDSALMEIGIIRQLFGIRRSDGRWGYDAMQVRLMAAAHNIVKGVLLSFVIVGMPFVLLGLLQLVYSIVTAQAWKNAFFDPDGRSGASVRQNAVIGI